MHPGNLASPKTRASIDRKQCLQPLRSRSILQLSPLQSWHSTGSCRDFHLSEKNVPPTQELPPKRPCPAQSPHPHPGAVHPPEAEPPRALAPVAVRRRPRPARPPARPEGMPPGSPPPPARPLPRGGVGGRSPRSHLVAVEHGARAATCTISPSALSMAPAREKRPVRPVVWVV